MLCLRETIWKAHLPQVAWGKLLNYKPKSAWNSPLLDSNVWIQNDQAVIMQRWRNVQNTGGREKEVWCWYNDFSETLQFWECRKAMH